MTSIADVALRLAQIGLTTRASRAAMVILSAQLDGRILRTTDLAEQIGWTRHNAARAVRELEQQAPGLLTPRDGYKEPLTFAIDGEELGPAPAPKTADDTPAAGKLGPIPAPKIGTDTGPKTELGPEPAPKIGTDTGPKMEIGTEAGPKKPATLVSNDMSRGVVSNNARDTADDNQGDTPPSVSQREATQDPEVITVGETTDRLAKLGFTLGHLTSPSTIQMIQQWRSWKTTREQLETAIAVAHEQNHGVRPKSPAYYGWAVKNVIQADQEAAREPTTKNPPTKRQAGTKHSEKSNQQPGSVRYDNLRAKDYSNGATKHDELPEFLRGD